MKNNLLLGFVLFISQPALAGSVHFTQIADQTVNLGAKIEIPVTITSEENQSVELSVLPNDVSEDVTFQFNHPSNSLITGQAVQVKLTVQTRTSAPSFNGKKITVQAIDANGEKTSTEVSLTVAPIYTVQILDGAEQGDDVFDFDSQTDVAYFRPHADGLQLVFINKSSKACVIHGEGLIQHQSTSKPSQPGESYLPPKIFPSSPADSESMYTIHDVYHPERHVVFNATKGF